MREGTTAHGELCLSTHVLHIVLLAVVRDKTVGMVVLLLVERMKLRVIYGVTSAAVPKVVDNNIDHEILRDVISCLCLGITSKVTVRAYHATFVQRFR